MSKNEEALRLSSRYIHTGNSGVTLSIFRDVKRVDRAELVVENGAFGAFHTTLQIRGNEYKGMTSHQLRDLALMFLDAADALENDCEIPLEQGGTVSAFENHKANIAGEAGDRRSLRNLPDSIARYLPSELGRGEAISLDPRCEDLAPFFSILREAKKSRDDEGMTAYVVEGKLSEQERKDARDRLQKAEIEAALQIAGFRYLTARRIFDLAELHLEHAAKALSLSATIREPKKLEVLVVEDEEKVREIAKSELKKIKEAAKHQSPLRRR